jgi:calcium-dependent protein kinase
VAPEILLGKFYNQSCDIWSLGVIMYILLSGYPPFFGNNKQEIFYKIEHCIYSLTTSDWARVSTTAKDLIRKLIEKGFHFFLNRKSYFFIKKTL